MLSLPFFGRSRVAVCETSGVAILVSHPLLNLHDLAPVLYSALWCVLERIPPSINIPSYTFRRAFCKSNTLPGPGTHPHPHFHRILCRSGLPRDLIFFSVVYITVHVSVCEFTSPALASPPTPVPTDFHRYRCFSCCRSSFTPA